MRTRTSHKPDGWRDDGPGRAALGGYAGSLVVGEPATAKAAPIGVICNAVMPIANGRCALLAGHADKHKSTRRAAA